MKIRGNAKHCEITSAILGRASGQTVLIKRLINPHFLNALGLHLPALYPPRGSERLESLGQLTRQRCTCSHPSPNWRESCHWFGSRKEGVHAGSGRPTEPTTFLSSRIMLGLGWGKWSLSLDEPEGSLLPSSRPGNMDTHPAAGTRGSQQLFPLPTIQPLQPSSLLPSIAQPIKPCNHFPPLLPPLPTTPSPQSKKIEKPSSCTRAATV